MADFSISDAALHGFRVAWERPRALVFWILLQLAVAVPYTLTTVFFFGPTLMKMTALAPTASDGGRAATQLISSIGPFYLFSLGLFVTFNAIVLAAMNRAVFRPGDDRFGYLRLGADELRQILVLLQITGLLIGACIVGVLCVSMVGDVVLAILGATSTPSTQAAMDAAALPVSIAVVIPLAVRFSLASPMTFATGKLALLGSWSLTRGRFWPLLATYGLATALIFIVYLLGYAVIFGSVAAVAGGAPKAVRSLMSPDLSSLTSFLSPQRWMELVLQGVLTALVWPLALTPAAVVYLNLTASRSETRALT